MKGILLYKWRIFLVSGGDYLPFNFTAPCNKAVLMISSTRITTSE